ncbi:HDOD domain-containing protein [Massilia sp. H6]|uniref:HDOD domain-containing protein n=1 Tax=Massilia sp. H6 TaxID=2970464 RepID=UPI0021686BAB|nr:HDOD domain-containing protein [Massilia sp. H6]UVW27532.1 HDOD domain-containing protein [Massilia sp. H6]
MKKWLDRLIGGTSKETDTAPGAGAGVAAAGDGAEMALEIDSAYYRWLTASCGTNARSEVEAAILAEVHALAGDPENASGLVPRIPDLVAQLLNALSNENISSAAVAAEVGRDLVLVAEVIREANSAYYRPAKPIETLDGAVAMLGLNGLRMLLARIAFRPLVKVKVQGVARAVAPSVWRHSERCAFAASVMAPGLSASVFEAYLAGLMQNVGLQVAFQVADRHGEGKVPAAGSFGIALFAASRQLSSVIAQHWEFPADVVEAIARAGDADALDATHLTQALVQGDRIAKLRLLLDAGVIEPEDSFVSTGLNGFQRRCLGKLADLAD